MKKFPEEAKPKKMKHDPKTMTWLLRRRPRYWFSALSTSSPWIPVWHPGGDKAAGKTPMPCFIEAPDVCSLKDSNKKWERGLILHFATDHPIVWPPRGIYLVLRVPVRGL